MPPSVRPADAAAAVQREAFQRASSAGRAAARRPCRRRAKAAPGRRRRRGRRSPLHLAARRGRRCGSGGASRGAGAGAAGLLRGGQQLGGAEVQRHGGRHDSGGRAFAWCVCISCVLSAWQMEPPAEPPEECSHLRLGQLQAAGLPAWPRAAALALMCCALQSCARLPLGPTSGGRSSDGGPSGDVVLAGGCPRGRAARESYGQVLGARP